MPKNLDLKVRIKDLRLCLFAQVVSVPLVILIFQIIEPKTYAGIVAGVLFILVGTFLVAKNFKWVNYKKSPTFWLACIHLFAIAIPMFMFRVTHLELAFDELMILGIPGPTLHKISERVFTALVVMTFLELTRARYLVSKSNQAL